MRAGSDGCKRIVKGKRRQLQGKGTRAELASHTLTHTRCSLSLSLTSLFCRLQLLSSSMLSPNSCSCLFLPQHSLTFLLRPLIHKLYACHIHVRTMDKDTRWAEARIEVQYMSCRRCSRRCYTVYQCIVARSLSLSPCLSVSVSVPGYTGIGVRSG